MLRKPKGVADKNTTSVVWWCSSCVHNLRQLPVCPVCKEPAEQRTVTSCRACEGSGWNSRPVPYRKPCYPCEGTGIQKGV